MVCFPSAAASCTSSLFNPAIASLYIKKVNEMEVNPLTYNYTDYTAHACIVIIIIIICFKGEKSALMHHFHSNTTVP